MPIADRKKYAGARASGLSSFPLELKGIVDDEEVNPTLDNDLVPETAEERQEHDNPVSKEQGEEDKDRVERW